MAGPDPQSILQAATGYWASKYVTVSSSLGLYEALAKGPADAEELSRRTGLPERSVGILADANVVLGLLTAEGGRYANGEAAATFLAGATPNDLRPVLRWMDRFSYHAWEQLEDALREGKPQTYYESWTAEETRLYGEAMVALSASAPQALLEIYDFSRHERVLDLGGGLGHYLIPILRSHEDLVGTLFDRFRTLRLARSRLEGDSVADRVEYVAGDVRTDELPEGHDVVLAANLLHNFPPEEARDILDRLAEVTPSGGRLLLVEFLMAPDRREPALGTLLAGELYLASGGENYTEERYRAWLEETGWRVVERRELPTPQDLLVAETG